MRVTDPITVQNWTRESFVAVDDNTNSQYRFGFQQKKWSREGGDSFKNAIHIFWILVISVKY
jgi:6-phosphofructokinase 2